MNTVLLGLGKASGMFYHAPAGTSLPSSATDAPGTSWEVVGDVDHDGITLSLSKDTDVIKNWNNAVRRVIMTSHEETIQAGIMDTTQESLETVFGDDNVTVTAASVSHGKQISVDLSPDDLPEPEAYLFIMKDGDNVMAIGTENGQISAIEDVAFSPDGAITWKPTITTISGWILMNDDGQTTT